MVGWVLSLWMDWKGEEMRDWERKTEYTKMIILREPIYLWQLRDSQCENPGCNEIKKHIGGRKETLCRLVPKQQCSLVIFEGWGEVHWMQSTAGFAYSKLFWLALFAGGRVHTNQMCVIGQVHQYFWGETSDTGFCIYIKIWFILYHWKSISMESLNKNKYIYA